MSGDETPIQRMLDELAPGERREHKRTIEPTGKEGRFWQVANDGRIANSSLTWGNRSATPSRDVRTNPFIRMSDIEEPQLIASEEESPIGDFYFVTTGLYFFADPLVGCIQSLDPNAIEVRKAVVRGDGIGKSFSLVLVKRGLDAIDVSRTDLLLENKCVAPERAIYVKHVYYPKRQVLRDDVPLDIHCFGDAYSGQLYFSTALMSCARRNGMHLFNARHPSGLSVFPDVEA